MIIALITALFFAAGQTVHDEPAECRFKNVDDVVERNATSAEKSFFQSSIWNCEGDREFYSIWYGRQLDALGEPSFAQPLSAKGFKARYRLLVLPSFTPAYSIRVDYASDKQGARATVVMGSGSGGYDPGKRIPLWSYELRSISAERLADAVRESGIAAMLQRSPLAGPDKDGNIVICGDGTQFVLEILGPDGEQRLWSRHSCDLDRDTEFAKLLQRLFLVGRLTIPYEVQNAIVESEKRKAVSRR